MRQVHIYKICEACKSGELAKLKKWKERGRLPDLMSAGRIPELPHEFAAEFGQLEVLAWLVHESGQKLDLVSNGNRAMHYAIFGGHFDVAQWLLFESGQLGRILEHYERWWVRDVPEELQDCISRAYGILDFLVKHSLPAPTLAALLCSATCCSAIETGLVQSVADLEDLLKTHTSTQVCRQKKL